MTRSHRTSRYAALATVVLLVLAACSSSKSSSSSATTAATGGTTTTAVTNDWALRYTLGTAGKADTTKTPIVIGYVNQQGSVPDYSEATNGINAAVQYVNNELGGIGGHPVQLSSCFVQVESDGQKCGTQFANDPKITLVITGAMSVGSQSLYNVIVGKKAVLVGNPLTTPDYVTKGITAYTPGAPGVVDGLAIFVAKDLPNVKSVAVIHGDSPSEAFAATGLFKPLAAKLGLNNVTLVSVSDTAQATDIQQAVQSAGADKADVLVTVVIQNLCAPIYDALQSLGVNPTVVSTGLCYLGSMTKHMQDIGSKDQVPNNWYFGGYGYSYFLPDQPSGMTTYLAKVKQYAPAGSELYGFAGPVFADLLTAVQFYNKIGPDQVTVANLSLFMKNWHGPMMIVAGAMNCGGFPNPLFVPLCGTQMGIQQYVYPNWISVKDALNGQPIDVTQY